MSPEEIQIFYNLGESLLGSIAGTTASTLLYGIFHSPTGFPISYIPPNLFQGFLFCSSPYRLRHSCTYFNMPFHELLTCIYRRRGLSNRPTWVMFMTTVVTFLIGTVYAATGIACLAVFVRAALMDNIDLPLNTNRMLSNMKLVKPSLAVEWIASLLVCSLLLASHYTNRSEHAAISSQAHHK